ncbi:hypothetical protein GQ55_8G063600 [Panicum hallii var. hallii]|uniref:Uncharacterized protein n=1 Tax=Panicum hallii var. hallii TaxID=1504633 RepID=A0A2T7CL84_9POAL|nr:hypothetical protein GQ55_8G063600 [Panicum hallii var. hallii]
MVFVQMKTALKIDAKSVGSKESNDGFSSRFQNSELNRQDPQSTGYTGSLATR